MPPFIAVMRRSSTYPQKILDRLCLIHHGQLVAFGCCWSAPPEGDFSQVAFFGGGAEEDPLVQKTIAHIQRLQSDEPTGHDWLHTQRVYREATLLAEMSPIPVDRQTVALAALLHDIADWKFNGGDEEAGPRAAAHWLEGCGAPAEQIAHIQEIIRDLSFKGWGPARKWPRLKERLYRTQIVWTRLGPLELPGPLPRS